MLKAKKLLTLSDAVAQVTQLKNQGKKVVFTNGCFDILHAGHVLYLEEAKALGDFLIVGLNSDNSVKTLKGANRPINSQLNRAIVLSALESVSAIVIFEDTTPIPTLEEIQPQIHVKGGDYKTPESLPEYQTVTKHGGIIKILPFYEGLSTTAIIQKIHS